MKIVFSRKIEQLNLWEELDVMKSESVQKYKCKYCDIFK